ncbi:MAG: PhzF family phenazine biosynthesis protein [Acidobacteria bacterium]|nr:PhzF family phenazine biosynthesis protein [Acidobacteriota bacterium]
MEIPILQVDAFTREAFKGNPAAVCLLTEPQSAEWMQRVAAEMNLAETAFLVPRANDDGFDLRWFTPAIEVPLCGHATLASAHALWETGALAATQTANFFTLSGWLRARQTNGHIEMDFPARLTRPAELPAALVEALGATPHTTERQFGQDGMDANYVLEFASAAEVRELRPDFSLLRRAVNSGVIVTARGDAPYDFISRYFACYAGIDEDPVTGSAHCALATYWASRLGKTQMLAYQASARGGEVQVRLNGDRVFLGGEAVTVLRGSLLC